MGDTYTELFYHLVWATKGREPFITEALEPHLYRFVRSKCCELGVLVHALNGMPDHLHLACTVPPRISVAEFVHDVKGASARFINEMKEEGFRLYWQAGYGALTLAKRDLAPDRRVHRPPEGTPRRRNPLRQDGALVGVT